MSDLLLQHIACDFGALQHLDNHYYRCAALQRVVWAYILFLGSYIGPFSEKKDDKFQFTLLYRDPETFYDHLFFTIAIVAILKIHIY